MKKKYITVGGIPAIVWGEKSDKVWLCVHGKMSSKEAFAELAEIADAEGCQTLSFDLPEHGDRKNSTQRCDIWNGIKDLKTVADYAFENFREVCLYGCSLGAYFSLHAFQEGYNFKKCLFQSPVIDMEHLIGKMMLWFGITLEQLETEKEVDNPVDPFRWDYYCYIKEHPITKWDAPTHILFGGRDDLQSREIMEAFTAKYGGTLTVSENSEHPFMSEKDGAVVTKWLKEHI